MSKTNYWPSVTGTIVRMEKRQGPKVSFVSLTLECGSKDSKIFRRDAIAFDNEDSPIMSELLALGVGTRIYARGPMKTATRETEAGAKYQVSTMTLRSIKVLESVGKTAETDTKGAEQAEVVESKTQETPSTAVENNLPALPEGATVETHTLYTKRNGEKAWRKKTAAQLAKAKAEANNPSSEEMTNASVESEPEKIETKATMAPVQTSDDTAMAAAFKAAFANA